jgi:C-terminal processing protease CtpA/Prc
MHLLDPGEKSQIVLDLIAKLKEKYIFPDVAEQVGKDLQQRLGAGEYDDLSEGEFFAYALTQHMQEISKDEHLWLRWHPEPLPEHDGSLLQNEVKLAELKQGARLKNYGIFKAERLPGNVGYLDIRYFYRPSWGSGDTAVAALNFLANTDALIVDVRQCQGGNPGMVALVTSYLFNGEPVHLNSLYWRDEDLTQQYWTLPYVPGKRLSEIPIYILTSAVTFSAGEEFAYNLKVLERATLVGETTSGGAHPGSPFKLHPHFEVFVPLGRAINPVTKENWEGVGVAPDINTSTDQAYFVAYQLALESILEKYKESPARPQERLLKEIGDAIDSLQ